MTISIRPDAGGFDRLPECITYLNQYMGMVRRTGRKNGHLFVQQYLDKQWAFEIYETKTQFVINVTTSDYIYSSTESVGYNN